MTHLDPAFAATLMVAIAGILGVSVAGVVMRALDRRAAERLAAVAIKQLEIQRLIEVQLAEALREIVRLKAGQ